MKRYTSILLQAGLLFFYACGNTDPKSATTNEKRKLVPNPEGHQKDTFLIQDDAVSEDRWHFKKYLNDPATPKLAKDVFHNNWQFNSANDEELLSFLDKLTDKNKQTRPFYFKVVTNSAKKADGAFSEALGLAGYEYVLNHPKEFADYFIGPGAFSDNDLAIWAHLVIGEIEINDENDNGASPVKTYVGLVNSHCKDCSPETTKVLERFSLYLEKEWRIFLERNKI